MIEPGRLQSVGDQVIKALQFSSADAGKLRSDEVHADPRDVGLQLRKIDRIFRDFYAKRVENTKSR